MVNYPYWHAGSYWDSNDDVDSEIRASMDAFEVIVENDDLKNIIFNVILHFPKKE